MWSGIRAQLFPTSKRKDYNMSKEWTPTDTKTRKFFSEGVNNVESSASDQSSTKHDTQHLAHKIDEPSVDNQQSRLVFRFVIVGYSIATIIGGLCFVITGDIILAAMTVSSAIMVYLALTFDRKSKRK